MKHPNTEFKFQNLLFSVDICPYDFSFAGYIFDLKFAFLIHNFCFCLWFDKLFQVMEPKII